MSRLSKSNKGFTIIETMIVLAIAGLIILIITEAIPALNRVARNNQRKQDVSKILQATSSFMLRNSANFPNTDPPINDDPLRYINLTHYDKNYSAVRFRTGSSDPSTTYNATDTNTVNVYNRARCSAAAPGTAVASGADYRSVVALFMIESGNGSEAECINL